MSVITNSNIKCNAGLAALQHVIDPEIGLNVVDLGLIYQLDFDDAVKKIYCRMTLTTQFCPMGESITNGVKKALTTTYPEFHAEIELTFNPSWSHQMISDEGRKFLNER